MAVEIIVWVDNEDDTGTFGTSDDLQSRLKWEAGKIHSSLRTGGEVLVVIGGATVLAGGGVAWTGGGAGVAVGGSAIATVGGLSMWLGSLLESVWRAPAQDDFAQAPVVSPMPVRLDPATAEAEPELSALVGSLGRAAGLAQALLDSLERGQGAAAAGDDVWVRRHSLAMESLTSALGARLLTASSLMDELAADPATGLRASHQQMVEALGALTTGERSQRAMGALAECGFTETSWLLDHLLALQPARLPAQASTHQALSRMAMTARRTGMQLLERG
ncbi:MAG: hypothetical protein WCA82_14550 [Jiangellales bacterium]